MDSSLVHWFPCTDSYYADFTGPFYLALKFTVLEMSLRGEDIFTTDRKLTLSIERSWLPEEGKRSGESATIQDW